MPGFEQHERANPPANGTALMAEEKNKATQVEIVHANIDIWATCPLRRARLD
jgi:hypothetical protein